MGVRPSPFAPKKARVYSKRFLRARLGRGPEEQIRILAGRFTRSFHCDCDCDCVGVHKFKRAPRAVFVNPPASDARLLAATAWQRSSTAGLPSLANPPGLVPELTRLVRRCPLTGERNRLLAQTLADGVGFGGQLKWEADERIGNRGARRFGEPARKSAYAWRQFVKLF
jgi:hypothetical protein